MLDGHCPARADFGAGRGADLLGYLKEKLRDSDGGRGFVGGVVALVGFDGASAGGQRASATSTCNCRSNRSPRRLSRDILISSWVDRFSPFWRTGEFLVGGQRFSWCDGPGVSLEGFDAGAGEGFFEADRGSVGGDEVGVVEESVDRGGGDGFWA